MEISKDVKYIGINDPDIRLFEGQYPTPRGMAYNSYVILDESIAVMDSVELEWGEEWLARLSEALSGRLPDYLVVQHMEPDHSANITRFVKAYPEAKIVASAAAFRMMAAFFGNDFKEKQIVVTEGSTLKLGRHVLTFHTAPMVHWPEVIVTYDSYDKILFSADGFGKFGTADADEPWADEARRYYIGIVGKYGSQVQALLKKASGLDIKTICPLHGPVLTEDLGYYIGLYDTWSSYRPEARGVTVAYASVYGNTRAAALLLADELRERGVGVELFDLTRESVSGAIASAFKHSHLVLASVTYNGDVFPAMRSFIAGLTERGYRDRTVALIENGSWAPAAARVMKNMLADSTGISLAESAVRITSAPNEGTRLAILALAEELAGSVLG